MASGGEGEMPGKRTYFAAIVLSLCLSPWAMISAADEGPLEFNRDIRPILSDDCFQCHGPDAKDRKADLRLDTEEGALAAAEGKAGDRPRQAGRERAWSARSPRPTRTSGCRRRCPAASSPPQQIELLRRWIEQGAKWQTHWSFIPPETPGAAGRADSAAWPRNADRRFRPGPARTRRADSRRPRPTGPRCSAASRST